MSAATKTVAEVLREPFTDSQIGKLPRVTCKDCTNSQRRRCDRHNWVTRCPVCGGSHTEAVIHLSYVGHAATTDRLLKADPSWSWEPVAFGPDGLPALDRNGGLWIRLTVHIDDQPVTRLGYGDAGGKSGGNAIKEAIGDALRNAAMRFGVAIDLWSKEDLADAEVQQGHHQADSGPQVVLREIAEAATAAGVQLADVAKDWADSHDGQYIGEATDTGGLELVRDDLLTKARQNGAAA